MNQSNLLRWLLYGIGSFGYSLVYTTLMQMHLYRYDPGIPNPDGFPVMASSALVGVAALLGRIFNPVACMAIGYFSDRTRSPWGRRRPYMAIALPPLIIGFILVFTPPVPDNSVWNAVYLTLTFILFFLAYAAYLTPYQALLPELSQTSEQRVRLSTFMSIFTLVGFATGAIAAPWLLGQFGFLQMALILAGVASISLIAPLGVQENLHLPPTKTLPFWQTIQIVCQNSLFQPYILSLIALFMTVNIFFTSSNYFVTALLGKPLGFGSVMNSFVFMGVMLGFLPLGSIVKRWGKRTTLQIFLVGLGCCLLGLSIWSLSSQHSIQFCLLLIALIGVMLAGVTTLPNTLLADIIDADEKAGVQRGAIYFGFQSMVITVTSGLASLVTGWSLTLGKTAMAPLGVQLICVLAGLFALIAAFTLSFYPLKT
jgi:GPH family glycoside/pentoside/hexuronide:cation symporter